MASPESPLIEPNGTKNAWDGAVKLSHDGHTSGLATVKSAQCLCIQGPDGFGTTPATVLLREGTRRALTPTDPPTPPLPGEGARSET